MSNFASHLKNALIKTADAVEKPHLKQRVIFIVIFVLALFAFAVLFMPKTSFSYYNPPQGMLSSDEIIAGADLYQEFETGDSETKSLLIDFETFNRKNYVIYYIELLDENMNKLTDAADNAIEPLTLNAVLINDEELYGMPLNIYDLFPDTKYYLHVYSEDAKPGNAVGVNISPNTTGAEDMLLGEENAGGVLNMMIGSNRFSNNVIILTIVLCVLFSVSVLFWSAENLARTTFIMVLVLGIMFALITPIMNSPDEPSHVGTAFALAEGNFLKTSAEQVVYTEGFTQLNYDYGIIANPAQQYIDWTQMPNFIDNNFINVPVPAETITTTWGAAKFFLGYLPQTAGLAFGHLLNLNLAAYFYIGRIFNIVVYAFCAYFAVKISPKFKLYLSVIALLPMSLFIAGSYNPDGLTYGLALLVGAKFADMFFNTDALINKKDILIMAALTALLCMNKYSLGLIALLTFFIPVKRFESRRLKWFGALFILIVSFIAAYAVMSWETYAAGGESSLAEGYVNDRGANASLQLSFLLNNPGTAVSIFSTAIMNDLGKEMLNLFALGGAREYGLFDILSLCYFAFLAVVAFSYTRFQSEEIKAVFVPGKTRVLIFGVIVITIFLTYLALYLTWTPLYVNTIEGVQSRYFVGLFPLIPFLGQNIYPKVTKDALIRSRYNCIFIAVLIAALTLMTTVVRFY